MASAPRASSSGLFASPTAVAVSGATGWRRTDTSTIAPSVPNEPPNSFAMS